MICHYVGGISWPNKQEPTIFLQSFEVESYTLTMQVVNEAILP